MPKNITHVKSQRATERGLLFASAIKAPPKAFRTEANVCELLWENHAGGAVADVKAPMPVLRRDSKWANEHLYDDDLNEKTELGGFSHNDANVLTELGQRSTRSDWVFFFLFF